MKKYTPLIITLFGFFLSPAQEILVSPYLQDATPTSIYIQWETSSGEESIVEYGLTEQLGSMANGSHTVHFEEGTVVHSVKLEKLTRFTKYFYRVKTGSATSETFYFKTPAFSQRESSFNILTMSDMQRDSDNPNKFREIIEEGVVKYLKENYTGKITEDVSLVLIPGDLVGNGRNHKSWKTEFFDPGKSVFPYIPVYPVLGNHEGNTPSYFYYFTLPDNGTKGFEEHWWYKDYSNTRIIGLDSNEQFAVQEQLDWLDSLLMETRKTDSIDFVFAQLHHPYKSELWTDGEEDFTGEVVKLLEKYTEDTGNPSIHFFGHTHGYSRGQSKNHKHLWVNVASAGGSIDNWGEFAQRDYDEFTKSQEEWGFMIVEVTAGDDPSFTIKRMSRGNDAKSRDNELRDSLTVRLHGRPVPKPSALPSSDLQSPDCTTLKASEYQGAIQHGASQWQIFEQTTDLSKPLLESWKQHENWYFDVNTQANDDLTDEQFRDLKENTRYFWRVRYRDIELNWSPWSDMASFTTGESVLTANLLINPGAEEETTGWSNEAGLITAMATRSEIHARSGDWHFRLSENVVTKDTIIVYQTVDLMEYRKDIAKGNLLLYYGGYLSGEYGKDEMTHQLFFLDKKGNILGSTTPFSTIRSSWDAFGDW
ncbi:MAG: metallophosphoesterase, partial [Cyclobacteriaceae bacterium]|nr:metallophosphoesterase [Cyclobacteriaceae bacterium]